MDGEIWRDIPGFEGAYQVSDLGRVRRLDRMVRHPSKYLAHGQILRPPLKPSGHRIVDLGRKNKNSKVHALVMLAFVGPRPAGLDTRHLNGIPSDNRLVNLEYATKSRNIQDVKWHGESARHRLTPQDALSIFKRRFGPRGTGISLAREYDVHPTTILGIWHGHAHRDITMLNLNRNTLSLEPINAAVNAAVERAAATTAELPRPYLGASLIGHDCARQVQYSWWCKPELAARTREIFDRGHYFEARMRRLLVAAGFKFAPDEACAFSAIDGALRGHADGIIHNGPSLPGAYVIYPLIWEHKCTNAKNWRAIERDGLEKAFPHYAAQVSLYQAYLDITNPALFTVTNADTCEWLHFLVPFNAERAQLYSDRAVNIIEATRAGELLPRAFDDPEDWRCRLCPHKERCWGAK